MGLHFTSRETGAVAQSSLKEIPSCSISANPMEAASCVAPVTDNRCEEIVVVCAAVCCVLCVVWWNMWVNFQDQCKLFLSNEWIMLDCVGHHKLPVAETFTWKSKLHCVNQSKLSKQKEESPSFLCFHSMMVSKFPFVRNFHCENQNQISNKWEQIVFLQNQTVPDMDVKAICAVFHCGDEWLWF